jgi:hypothetical protein
MVRFLQIYDQVTTNNWNSSISLLIFSNLEQKYFSEYEELSIKWIF